MNPMRRPLSGCVVNLSISESDDSLGRGFPGWQVNRVSLQVVVALFGQGVGVVFGHDWREDGVMEVVRVLSGSLRKGHRSCLRVVGQGRRPRNNAIPLATHRSTLAHPAGVGMRCWQD